MKKEAVKINAKSYQDLDIVLLGEVGLGGTLKLLDENFVELKERFIPRFFHGLKGKSFSYNEVLVQSILEKNQALYIQLVRETGVLGALWDLGQELKLGYQTQLKALPISQEIIEICEFLNVNPYRLESIGSRIILTSQGKDLVKDFENEGYTASFIGRTREGNLRTIEHGEDIRHVDRPTQVAKSNNVKDKTKN